MTERHRSSQHLKQQHPQTPHSHLHPILFPQRHLRGDVVADPSQSAGLVVGGSREGLGATHVNEDGLTVVHDDDVFGVDVAVNDVLGVQVVEGGGERGKVVPGELEGKR